LHLAERFYGSSALPELLSVPAEKVNEGRLYRALDALPPHEPALEKHLKEKLGELFELDYDLLLYDVTSTYFEGQAEKNPQALRGYSRDHRPDCEQINIALVVSRCGMPLGYGSSPAIATTPPRWERWSNISRVSMAGPAGSGSWTAGWRARTTWSFCAKAAAASGSSLRASQ
jgi:hypothetical protein